MNRRDLVVKKFFLSGVCVQLYTIRSSVLCKAQKERNLTENLACMRLTDLLTGRFFGEKRRRRKMAANGVNGPDLLKSIH